MLHRWVCGLLAASRFSPPPARPNPLFFFSLAAVAKPIFHLHHLFDPPPRASSLLWDQFLIPKSSHQGEKSLTVICLVLILDFSGSLMIILKIEWEKEGKLRGKIAGSAEYWDMTAICLPPTQPSPGRPRLFRSLDNKCVQPVLMMMTKPPHM